MKTCTRCKVAKDSSEFHKSSASSDGLKSACKECVNGYYTANKESIRAKQDEWYEENKDKRIEYVRKWRGSTKRNTSVSRRDRKKYCVEYKGNACADCGFQSEYLSVFDFHHIDPSTKSFQIATVGRSCKLEKLNEELDKCVLLCANCHRIRHEKEKKD